MISNGITRTLLLCGAIAGPLYVLVGLVQILIRPGFDVSKHALSLMSNGDLGWIQITNFIVTGMLVLAFGVGLRRLLKDSKAGTFGPLLLAVYGVGLIGAGIFSADPALGFPPGTPEDTRDMSTNGLLHFVFGGIGFYGLIAACSFLRGGSERRANAAGSGSRSQRAYCSSRRSRGSPRALHQLERKLR